MINLMVTGGHIVKLTAFPGCKSTTCVVFTRPSLPEAVTVYVPGTALTNTDVCCKHNTQTSIIIIA